MLSADASWKVTTFEKPGKAEYSVPMGTCRMSWRRVGVALSGGAPLQRVPATSGTLPGTQRPSGSRILELKAPTPFASRNATQLGSKRLTLIWGRKRWVPLAPTYATSITVLAPRDREMEKFQF